MTEREPQSPNPQEILQLKDKLVACWQQLPVAHQATMLLVLFDQTREGAWGVWLNEAIRLRWPEVLPEESVVVNAMSKADLLSVRPDLAEEISALKQDEMKDIALKMGEAMQDTYWLAMELTLEHLYVEAPNDTSGDPT